MKAPIKVLVSGAAGNIGYSFIPLIAGGEVFGKDQPIIIVLFDIPRALKALKGVVMELQDGCFPLVAGWVASATPSVAFKDVDVCVMLGGFPRKKGMVRSDLIGKNVKIYGAQGKALDRYAKKTVKVLVVANPCNTNVDAMRKSAPSIPKENFTAMTRLDLNRAKAQIALRWNAAHPDKKIGFGDISGVTIWGNHSATQYPDVAHGSLKMKDGSRIPIRKALAGDEAWMDGDFIKTVQKRGKAIILARGKSSAQSAAVGAAMHLRDWFLGTPEGEFVCMAVCSDGNPYGIAPGLMYSFPVTCKDGKWAFVPGLPISEVARRAMEKSQNELIKEREVSAPLLRARL
jgi:malate dehydrogenase